MTLQTSDGTLHCDPYGAPDNHMEAWQTRPWLTVEDISLTGFTFDPIRPATTAG
jgi:hypothetical protein